MTQVDNNLPDLSTVEEIVWHGSTPYSAVKKSRSRSARCFPRNSLD